MNVGSVYVLVLDGDMFLLVIIIFKIVCFIAAVNEVLSILYSLDYLQKVLCSVSTCLEHVCMPYVQTHHVVLLVVQD